MIEEQKIRKYLNRAIKGLFFVLGTLMIFGIMIMEMGKLPAEERQRVMAEQIKMVEAIAAGEQPKNPSLGTEWPPLMNKPYPDLDFIDSRGAPVMVKDFAEKVVLVEYIDVSAPQSQSQSGGLIVGSSVPSITPDTQALPFRDVFDSVTNNAQALLRDDNVVHVKVIIYGEGGRQALVDDAERWSTHFAYDDAPSVHVVVPQQDMRNTQTENMIAGYQLVDRKGLLRVDSAGMMPKHSLRLTLIPLAEKLLKN